MGKWQKKHPLAKQWTLFEINFLRANYLKLTNKEMSTMLGIKLTSLRTQLYLLGLKRMELEYWTAEQVSFLLDHYKEIGDVEMAEIFQEKWPKNKKWTLKHIEKKRGYLKLTRTPKEIENIFFRNKENGRFKDCNFNRWVIQGVFPEGTIRIWKNQFGNEFMVIKTKKGFRPYAPLVYREHFGEPGEGMVVTTRDGDTLNIVPENLVAVTRAEITVNNSLKRYPEELREIVQLNREIKKRIQQNYGK